MKGRSHFDNLSSVSFPSLMNVTKVLNDVVIPYSGKCGCLAYVKCVRGSFRSAYVSTQFDPKAVLSADKSFFNRLEDSVYLRSDFADVQTDLEVHSPHVADSSAGQELMVPL